MYKHELRKLYASAHRYYCVISHIVGKFAEHSHLANQAEKNTFVGTESFDLGDR